MAQNRGIVTQIFNIMADKTQYHQLVHPFIRWGNRYYGLCVQSGEVVTKPSENEEWTEYHLDYRGGEIWELEVCPSENTGWTVWRGKIPNREVFKLILENIEQAPPIIWE